MLGLAGIAVRFADTTILKDVSFQMQDGERWGIIGRNGIGKTSLFEVITGDLTPAEGVVTKSQGIKVAVLDQHRTFEGADTVWEAAAGAYKELRRLEVKLAEDAIAMSEAGDSLSQELLDQYARSAAVPGPSIAAIVSQTTERGAPSAAVSKAMASSTPSRRKREDSPCRQTSIS